MPNDVAHVASQVVNPYSGFEQRYRASQSPYGDYNGGYDENIFTFTRPTTTTSTPTPTVTGRLTPSMFAGFQRTTPRDYGQGSYEQLIRNRSGYGDYNGDGVSDFNGDNDYPRFNSPYRETPGGLKVRKLNADFQDAAASGRRSAIYARAAQLLPEGSQDRIYADALVPLSGYVPTGDGEKDLEETGKRRNVLRGLSSTGEHTTQAGDPVEMGMTAWQRAVSSAMYEPQSEESPQAQGPRVASESQSNPTFSGQENTFGRRDGRLNDYKERLYDINTMARYF